MRIIDKIEINYFRSIYNLVLSGTGDINVFIGGNDVGKSNILKALNLFFNNYTEIDYPFDFLSDLSRLREEEARSAKGRATIWVRITFNNFLGWTSLPEKFAIKHTWNRYEPIPAKSFPQDVHSVTIAKFLNKISFHYIPAVRSRDIFEHFLGAMHDALIDDEKAGVRAASNSLMEAINTSTEDMSDRILQGLGFDSNIQVPRDLTELFEALDFSTKFSGYNVPLQQRGDGIQARHIPFILDFIGRHSKKSHIWAYEEPENSLEMSRAFELAEQFDQEFHADNQIFITTHSPAFYDLEGTHVVKWLVDSEDNGPGDKPITTATTISASEHADRRLGIAALVTGRAREVYEENKGLKETLDSLEAQVAAAGRAQVIVEGPTDAKILSIAFGKLYPDDTPFCDSISGNGANNVGSFIKTISRLNRAMEVPIIGLVDNDNAGRTVAQKFRSYKYVNGTDFRSVKETERIYFGVLPVPEEFFDVHDALKRVSGKEISIPLSIEFMFPRSVIEDALTEGVLDLNDRYSEAKDGELALTVNLTSCFTNDLPEGYEYFAREVDTQCKNGFADWVGNQEPEAFSNFRQLFDVLRNLSNR